jgi:hypothetical protein
MDINIIFKGDKGIIYFKETTNFIAVAFAVPKQMRSRLRPPTHLCLRQKKRGQPPSL